MTREEAIELAKIAEQKKQVLNGLSMMNVANLTPEQRVESGANYSIAYSEWKWAESQFNMAMQKLHAANIFQP